MNTSQLTTSFVCLFLIGSAEVVAGPMMGFMGPHFNVHSSAIAYLPAAYGLTYGAVALVAGPLSDRLGRKRPLLAGLWGFCLLSALMPAAPSLAWAIALSALSGLCAAIIQPNVMSFVADASAPELVPRRIGQVFVGLMLAFVLTPALAGALAQALGWGAAYYLMAAVAAAAALAVTLSFPAHRAATAPQADFWATHRDALATPGARLRLSASYLWLGWVAGFGAVVAEVAARKLQISPAQAGLVAGYFGLAVIAGNLCSARLHQLLGERAAPAMAMASALGVMGFMLPTGSILQLLLPGTLWAFGYGCAGPLHHARLSRLSDSCRGTLNSYHASLLNLGIFSVSFLLGSLAPAQALTVFFAAVAAVALGGAGLLVVGLRREVASLA